MNFYRAIIVIPLLLFLPNTLKAETVLDLEAAVKQGLEFNEQIKAAEHAFKASEAGKNSALGGFGPSVTVNYSYQRLDEEPIVSNVRVGDQDNWTLNMNISQPLFRGFFLLNSYQRAKLSQEVASENLRQARLDVTLAIQENFLEYLKAVDFVKSAQDSLARLESQLKVSQSFFRVGLRPKLDVLQSEVDVADAEQGLLRAQNRVKTQKARLNTLLNWEVNKDVQYVGALDYFPFDRTFESCLEQAKNDRPDLRIAKQSVQIGEEDAGIAASDFYPDVTATFDYFRFGDGPEVDGSEFQEKDEWRAGASLSWTLFESGSTYFSYQEARRNLDRLIAEKNSVEKEVSFTIRSNFLNVEEASERIQVAIKGVTAAREGYRQAQARYRSQVGTSTDVLDAQARLTESEVALIEALADYRISLATLYASMGEERLSLQTVK